MTHTHSPRYYRSKVASYTRSRQPDDPDFIAARQGLAESMLAQHIRNVIDKAPPLRIEQRDRIVSLLLAVPVVEDEGGDER